MKITLLAIGLTLRLSGFRLPKLLAVTKRQLEPCTGRARPSFGGARCPIKS
jgi:hypothetical protein